MPDYLLDTNVGLRFVERSDRQHHIARRAVKTILANQDPIYVTAQNLIEAWNVGTRPLNRNGYGRSQRQVLCTIRLLERLFPLLVDTPAVYTEWLRLVVKYNVSGVQVHDARLVAVMLVHNVTYILTFNTIDFIDFVRYSPEGITAIDPVTV